MSQQASKIQQIQTGGSLPEADFFTFKSLLGEGGEPEKAKAADLFRDKKVVLFGIPGACTPVCSAKHVPGFQDKYDEFKKRGVDKILCTAVNDAYVMKDWFKTLKVDYDKVQFVADPDGSFHRSVGLEQEVEGLGKRCLRYSMLVKNGEVQILNVEKPGGKSFEVSDAEKLLKDMDERKEE